MLVSFGMLVVLIGTCISGQVLKKILLLLTYEISTLFEAAPGHVAVYQKEGVVAVDDRGEVTLINDAAQELLNYLSRRTMRNCRRSATHGHRW